MSGDLSSNFDRVPGAIGQEPKAENVPLVGDEHDAVDVGAVVCPHDRAARRLLTCRLRRAGAMALRERDERQDGDDARGEFVHMSFRCGLPGYASLPVRRRLIPDNRSFAETARWKRCVPRDFSGGDLEWRRNRVKFLRDFTGTLQRCHKDKSLHTWT